MASFALTHIKRIVVTGANKGIGKAIAKKILSDHSDTFVYLGCRDQGRGDETCKDLRRELGPTCCEGRLEPLLLDVTDDASVASAAQTVLKASHGDGGSPAEAPCLYGLVNNAGVGFGGTVEETLATNLFGARRVTESFLPLLENGGRVVNIASASGPNFVAKLPAEERGWWSDPSKLPTWDQLEEKLEAKYCTGGPDYDGIAYGLSKACLNVYTQQVARREDGRLFVNSCTPGYINTDLTAGMGATSPPEKGTVAPLVCLFGALPPIEPPTWAAVASHVADSSCPAVAGGSSGRYYGSDGVRSPLDRYRGPGDPPFEGP